MTATSPADSKAASTLNRGLLTKELAKLEKEVAKDLVEQIRADPKLRARAEARRLEEEVGSPFEKWLPVFAARGALRPEAPHHGFDARPHLLHRAAQRVMVDVEHAAPIRDVGVAQHVDAHGAIGSEVAVGAHGATPRWHPAQACAAARQFAIP